MKSKTLLTFSIILLFILRLIYGLSSEFWFEDELQIYLIGLKSFTTKTWPFFGPDVVYTSTQIPGALQGLLVSLPFYIAPVPEAPCVFLNTLTFSSLLALAFYISKRIQSIPFWFIVIWIMVLTWPMDYGTRVVNPSYVLVFSVPFFIALLELLPIFEKKIISRNLSCFILGIAPGFIMQLHLSYFLLLPLIGLVVLFGIKANLPLRKKIISVIMFLFGFLTGILTLIPTYLQETAWQSTSSNIVFNLTHFKNILTVLIRYLYFASFEISYILGGSNAQRLEVIKSNIWAAPFTVYLWLFGLLMLGAFVFVFFKKESSPEWKKIKYLTLFLFVITFSSFFFSVKGPSSHTFFIVFPLVLFFSMYCHEWLINKYKIWKKLMLAAMVSCLFFYTSLGLYNFKHKSLYKDRESAVKAINEKNYKILGERRADKWGYGY